jgi:dethiobiotin synthetase
MKVPRPRFPGVFIIGTDTDVGKTFQACLLARDLRSRGLRVGVYKPVASGVPQFEDEAATLASDAALLRAAAQTPESLERVCPQSFQAAVAPPIAARLEGRTVDEPMLRSGAQWWKHACDFLIVEGAGGALSPLSESQTVLDLAGQLQLPLIVVAANRVGVVNHSLLTLEAIAARRLVALGVVLNPLPSHSPPSPAAQLATATNGDLLRKFCPPEVNIVTSIEALVPLLIHAS